MSINNVETNYSKLTHFFKLKNEVASHLWLCVCVCVCVVGMKVQGVMVVLLFVTEVGCLC